MPTILTHAAVPLAIRLGLGPSQISRRLLLAGTGASIAPDLDGMAFKLGIAYADAFGHRGATHSMAFALLLGALAAVAASRLQATRAAAFAFVFLCALSHPMLDMLTNGGLGVALWWPFSEARHFAPWQVIEVSPIALRRVFSQRGLEVLFSEIVWVWWPALACAMALRKRGMVASGLRRAFAPAYKPGAEPASQGKRGLLDVVPRQPGEGSRDGQ